MTTLTKYNKLFVALAGAVVAIVGQFAGIESDTYVVVVTLLTALGVYGVPNKAA